jgi:MinD superfamily P-loop ATPase
LTFVPRRLGRLVNGHLQPAQEGSVKIVVASGKGGTGKTTVATNAAHVPLRKACSDRN